MYLDLGRWITGSALCLSGPLKWLAYSRIDLLCCSISLHLKGTWETQNHQTFCMRLVSFTLLIYSCMFIIIETLHDQSLHLKIASETPNHQLLGTRGPRVMTSQCMKLVLVSFTLIYSATCALSFHINVCAGYMCFLVYFSGRWF